MNKIATQQYEIPSRPQDSLKVQLSENAYQVFKRRYLRRGDNGKPIESVEDTFWRVAYHIAKEEEKWGKDIEKVAARFYELLASKRFLPNSPTFTGAGTPLGQLAACFVLPLTDDMGRREDGIFQTLRNAALIQQTGGGNGFSFSQLRPQGDLIKTSAGHATGPIGFLHVYDQAFGEIAQGGSRRGANMAVLRVDHPDIEKFITCKTSENAITNFNISVAITDSFMKAVEEDDVWRLRFPDVKDPAYRGFHGTLEEAEDAGIPIKVYETVHARNLFNKIVEQSHHNGEPGILFLDTANCDNPVPHLYTLKATNPCGEQFLGDYENCCLGSVNLAQHATENGCVDWEKLEESVEVATCFLDDVVDANVYVPAIPKLQESAHRARRIGLGIMGLGDLMYQVGAGYGSDAGQEFAAQVMEFIRYHTMRTSVEIAEERGAFPAIQGSIYDPQALAWQPPSPLSPYQRDWERPSIDWKLIVQGIKEHGIRNAAQTTIAPTGTTGTVSGCEGYGCEPVFALAYTRHVEDSDEDLKLIYTSPLFEEALIASGLKEETRLKVVEQVLEKGSCQGIEEIPEDIRKTFVVAQDISAEEHVRTQAALQAFVDNSISKTINFPVGTQVKEVAEAYKLAWKLGCKGLTVYVTGSREKVVLETNVTSTEADTSAGGEKEGKQLRIWNEAKKVRPQRLIGYTYSIQTPLGKTFVTINENGSNQPFEVFVNTSKAGSDTAAVSEAIGRSLSYILRLSSPVSPRERMTEIVRQLTGIGGRRPLGFGSNRVHSLPDGVAQALEEYLDNTKDMPISTKRIMNDNDGHVTSERQSMLQIGDLCPDCGQATLINEEGCRKCYSCGYSEC